MASSTWGIWLPDFIRILLPGHSRAWGRSQLPGTMCRGAFISVRLMPSRAATAQKLGTPGTIRVSKPRAFTSSIR